MDEPLNELLNSGSIGIDKDRFLVDQTTLISAMKRTDRIFLLRILSKVEKVSFDELLDQSLECDSQHIIQIMNDAEKFVKH